MLTRPKAPVLGIKQVNFGRSGKMIIKPYSIPVNAREKYLKAFIKHVKIILSECWEWQGRIHNGYSCFSTPGGNTKWAHRVSYALFNGDIKAQMHIDHKCRNRKCVNPAHLEQMTPIENYLAARKRMNRDNRLLKEKMGQLTLW